MSQRFSRHKRQAERQTNERFRVRGPRRCRVLRRTNCGNTQRNRKIDYSSPYGVAHPRSVFRRIAKTIAKGVSFFVGRKRAKMLALWIKNKIIYFTSPKWFALSSTIGALIIVLLGTYFLPFLP